MGKRADTKMMKEMNKNLIRNHFRVNLETTAAQLAQYTGLSVVTVNALLREMVESQEIFVGESMPSNGGRPSTLYHYNDMFRCAAVIYGFNREGIDHIQLLVTNLLGKCIYEKTCVFEEIKDHSFDDLLDEAFKIYPTIEAIAFGLPGTEENGVITINDYKEIIGDTFLKHYKERYKVPIIFVNDINAAVNGYYHHKLEEEKAQTVVGLVFNRVYLPGSGIVINGEMYTGKANFAGEVAYMPIEVDWLSIDYTDQEVITEAVSKVIAFMSCVIAPDHFVVYGDFWTEGSEALMKEKAEKLLKHVFKVNVTTSHTFEEDYKLGMIKVATEMLHDQNQV